MRFGWFQCVLQRMSAAVPPPPPGAPPAANRQLYLAATSGQRSGTSLTAPLVPGAVGPSASPSKASPAALVPAPAPALGVPGATRLSPAPSPTPSPAPPSPSSRASAGLNSRSGSTSANASVSLNTATPIAGAPPPLQPLLPSYPPPGGAVVTPNSAAAAAAAAARKLSDMKPHEMTPDLTADARLHAGASLRSLRKSISGPAGTAPGAPGLLASPPATAANGAGTAVLPSLAVAAAARAVVLPSPTKPPPAVWTGDDDGDGGDGYSTTILTPEAVAANFRFQQTRAAATNATPTKPAQPQSGSLRTAPSQQQPAQLRPAVQQQPLQRSVTANPVVSGGSSAPFHPPSLPSYGSLSALPALPTLPALPPLTNLPPLPPLLPIGSMPPPVVPTLVPLQLPDAHADAAFQWYTTTAPPLLPPDDVSRLCAQLSAFGPGTLQLAVYS